MLVACMMSQTLCPFVWVAGGCELYSDTDELLEQSIGPVQYRDCDPHILCDVHTVDHYCFSHYVPSKDRETASDGGFK